MVLDLSATPHVNYIILHQRWNFRMAIDSKCVVKPPIPTWWMIGNVPHWGCWPLARALGHTAALQCWLAHGTFHFFKLEQSSPLLFVAVLETGTWQNTPTDAWTAKVYSWTPPPIRVSKFPCLNIWLFEVLTPPNSLGNYMSAFRI